MSVTMEEVLAQLNPKLRKTIMTGKPCLSRGTAVW